MEDSAALDKCRAYIDCQTRAGARRVPPGAPHGPAVTLARQTGTGGPIVAEQLAAYLETHAPADHCRWTVFDKNLVEAALEEHHLPRRFAPFVPEDRLAKIRDAMEELLGLHPPGWTLVRQTTETILHLATMGHVILVGRGANVITARLSNVFHARLVGSREHRLERVMTEHNLDRKAALERLEKEDRGRERYLREHFRCHIEDPLLYHLVVNTDRIPLADAARLIGDAALQHFQRVSRETVPSERSR